MMRGLVSATYEPTAEVAGRSDPWAIPPGANRDGTRGRLPTAIVGPSYGPAGEPANAARHRTGNSGRTTR